jgi:hypothetical protein
MDDENLIFKLRFAGINFEAQWKVKLGGMEWKN